MAEMPMIVTDGDKILLYAWAARRWAVLGLVLGLLGGAAVFLTQPARYVSTTAIELSTATPIVDLNPGGQRIKPLSPDTEAKLLVGDEVLRAVARADQVSVAAARSNLSITARSLTRVLLVSYTGSSPAGAQRGALAAAETYLGVRNRLVVQPVRDYLAAVQRATQDARKTSTAPDDQLVTGNQSLLETRRERAVGRELTLPGPGDILESGQVRRAEGMGLERPLASGAALGLLAGLLIGVARESRRRPGRAHDEPHGVAAQLLVST